MKARILLSATLIFGFLVSRAQQLTLETPLDATVNETSGLLFLNSTLITHNDSENANELYDIDSTTGLVTRTVTISNATNADWEDLANDDTYIYIGDFGNFRGDRTDLKIYRIAIADYFASTSVTADVINFSYSDQTDFTPNPLATNFDAEGLIHYNNNLYVFTKNWLDGNTNIYELPKTPGTHSISNIDSIMAQGLVSGATYNALDNSIFITGYDLSGAFLIQLSGFNSGLFSNGTVTRTSVSVPANFSVQVEAITPINANEYYITSEENSPDASGLFSFNVSTLEVSETHIEEFSFYPNPADEKIVLSNDQLITHIYTVTGQFVSSSNKREIDISELKSGVYIIKMQDEVTGNSQIRRLLIN